LAGEIKDKYKLDPNVMVIQKPYVTLNNEHKTLHIVPALPWKEKQSED